MKMGLAGFTTVFLTPFCGLCPQSPEKCPSVNQCVRAAERSMSVHVRLCGCVIAASVGLGVHLFSKKMAQLEVPFC